MMQRRSGKIAAMVAALALAMALATPAFADGPSLSRVPIERKTYVALTTGVSVTCLAGNTQRHGFSIMFTTSNGTPNAAVTYMTTSTNGATGAGGAFIVRAATSANGTPMIGGATWNEDGSGGFLYDGPVTVIGTTGGACNSRDW